MVFQAKSEYFKRHFQRFDWFLLIKIPSFWTKETRYLIPLASLHNGIVHLITIIVCDNDLTTSLPSIFLYLPVKLDQFVEMLTFVIFVISLR